MEESVYFKSVKESVWRGKFKTLSDYYLSGGNIDTDSNRLQYDPKYYSFDKYELQIDPDEPLESVENYDTNRRKKEIIKCSNSFAYFCHKYVKILHAVHGTIPFITYKYQRRVANFYQKEKYSIVSKFRQGGLTTIATLFALWKCLFFEGQSIYLLSRTDREAMEAGLMIDRALENMPKWLWEKDANITKHEKVFGETKSRACFYTPVAIQIGRAHV